MFKDVKEDLIFCDFMASFKVDADLKSIESELQNLYDENSVSKVYSNEGGYHSDVYHDFLKPECPTFSKANKDILEFVNSYIIQKEIHLPGYKFESKVSWWFLYNWCNNWNMVHTHGTAFLIGVFYIKAPPNSGNFCLGRNDGTAFSGLYTKSAEKFKPYWSLEPEEGRFYLFPGHIWHMVSPNWTEEKRISIAYNFNR